MANSQVGSNDKNPTNGTFTAQLVRGNVILEYRADEIRLRKTAFRYILDTTMGGANVVYIELHLPLGITGNRDKYTISNPDGPVTATCDLKYASDPEPLSFQASSGQITFYEFDTSTGKVHARFNMRAIGKNGELLEVNGGEFQLVGIGR
ncbi:hypothetical protein [Pseudomonas sp.]|uniref:hypothetical protein n=1 Tax=Pseudomonas sp. TaxID=306 RepID=UPI003D6DE012